MRRRRGRGSGIGRIWLRCAASPSGGRTCSRSCVAGGRDPCRAGLGSSGRREKGYRERSPSRSSCCGTSRRHSPDLPAAPRPVGSRIPVLRPCCPRCVLQKSCWQTVAMMPTGFARPLPTVASRPVSPLNQREKSTSRMTRRAIATATRSRICSENSRTGGAFTPATTGAPTFSCPQSRSQSLSPSGYRQ